MPNATTNVHTICANCGTYILDNQEYMEASNGDLLHIDCPNDEDFQEREWNRSEALETGKKGKIMQSTRLFGLENEIGYVTETDVMQGLAKMDKHIGLIEDSGAEFQTPPSSGDKAEALINQMGEVFNNGKFSVRNGQGLHVHIDCKEFVHGDNRRKFEIAQSLWLFYIVFDKTIRLFTNRYRQGIAKEYHTCAKNCFDYEAVRDLACMHDLEKHWYDTEDTYEIDEYKSETKHESRYKGVNMHSLFNDGHVEIRYHESTLDARAMLEWANLHCLIMDKAVEGIPVEWLDKVNAKKLRRRDMFKFLGLSTKSRRYFRNKATKK